YSVFISINGRSPRSASLSNPLVQLPLNVGLPAGLDGRAVHHLRLVTPAAGTRHRRIIETVRAARLGDGDVADAAVRHHLEGQRRRTFLVQADRDFRIL